MEDILKDINSGNKTNRIFLRVTEEDKERIEELAKQCGMGISEYCRKAALGQQPRKALSEEEIEILRGLKTLLQSVNNFSNALKQFSKDMTKEQRTAFILDGRTIAEWGKVIDEIKMFCQDVKNKMK